MVQQQCSEELPSDSQINGKVTHVSLSERSILYYISPCKLGYELIPKYIYLRQN